MRKSYPDIPNVAPPTERNIRYNDLSQHATNPHYSKARSDRHVAAKSGMIELYYVGAEIINSGRWPSEALQRKYGLDPTELSQALKAIYYSLPDDIHRTLFIMKVALTPLPLKDIAKLAHQATSDSDPLSMTQGTQGVRFPNGTGPFEDHFTEAFLKTYHACNDEALQQLEGPQTADRHTSTQADLAKQIKEKEMEMEINSASGQVKSLMQTSIDSAYMRPNSLDPHTRNNARYTEEKESRSPVIIKLMMSMDLAALIKQQSQSTTSNPNSASAPAPAQTTLSSSSVPQPVPTSAQSSRGGGKSLSSVKP